MVIIYSALCDCMAFKLYLEQYLYTYIKTISFVSSFFILHAKLYITIIQIGYESVVYTTHKSVSELQTEAGTHCQLPLRQTRI